MGIYVSVQSPSKDLEQSDVSKAITALATKLFQLGRANHLPKSPQLDLTFMLSTEKDLPEFHGMRMGGYTDKGDTLFFEIAVPVEMSYSKLAPDYIKATLFDVIDNADDYFSENGISSFNRQEWIALASSLIGEEMAPVLSH